jgi:hypothetical protein
VHLEPDLLPVVFGKLANFAQRTADLFERLLLWNFLRQAVRTDLHAGGADVVSKDDILLGRFDIGAEFSLVRRVIIKRAAQPHQRYF